MIKTVIFDLDDTLISEYEYVQSGYREVSRYLSQKYKIHQTTVYDELIDFYKKSKGYVFNNWFDYHSIKYEKNEITELVGVYRNHVPTIHFFEDVIPCVSFLKKNQIFTGIISDGYLETQTKKIDVLRASDYFDKIVLTEELGREYWKPSSKAFFIIKEYFGVSYEEMMYVGDNPKKDFYIKRELPITTVRILRPNSIYFKEQYLENVREDYRIESLMELEKIL